jgi:hypothetical protein
MIRGQDAGAFDVRSSSNSCKTQSKQFIRAHTG